MFSRARHALPSLHVCLEGHLSGCQMPLYLASTQLPLQTGMVGALLRLELG